MTQSIKVFISYSHDSPAHRQFVLQISNKLRAEGGLECQIDQYLNGSPTEGWQHWMENQVETADFVLLVCTPLYLKRYKGKDSDGGRGVTFEGLIINQTLYDAHYKNTKFIPVIPDDGSIDNVPLVLKGFNSYRLDDDYEGLYRVLTNQPATPPPGIGNIKELPQGGNTANPFKPEKLKN